VWPETFIPEHDVTPSASPPPLHLPYTVPTVTAEQQHRAALTVAARSLGRDDCRLLLAMLGLDGAR
jgi:hypothetical protein